MEEIRVVIVDDDRLVRRALRVFIEAADGITIVGEAADGVDGVATVRDTRPDVVLLDMHMPRMGGVEAAAQIASGSPMTHVLAITTFGTIEAIEPMLRAGASGYLLKDAEPEAIIEAIRLIQTGASALSPEITACLMSSHDEQKRASTSGVFAEHPLSDREIEVLEQLARGRSNAEIARAISISESTVKTHLSSIMTKWHVRDRVQILIRAARNGLIRFH